MRAEEDKDIIKPISGRRYTELDGMRGLAALTVFFSHFIMGNVVTAPYLTMLRMSPLHLVWDGSSAVLFFFILSGFVLALPYVNDPDRPLALWSFYLKRILRIYPAYLFAILASLALKHFVFHPEHMKYYSGWLNYFWKWNFSENMGDNIVTLLKTLGMIISAYNTDAYDPVIWSLVIEMTMSFLMPFLIFSVRKNGIRFSVGFILAFLFVGINFWVGTFYIGIVLAKYWHFFGIYFKKASKLVVILLFIVASCLYSSRFVFRQENANINFNYVSASGSVMFILLGLYIPRFRSFLKGAFCTFLGKISYSFYLIHLPILLAVASVMPYTNEYSLIPVFIVSLTSSLIAAYLMYKYIEISFQKYAHKVVSKHAFWRKLQFR